VGPDLRDANFVTVTETDSSGALVKGVVDKDSVEPKPDCYIVTKNDQIWEMVDSQMKQTDAVSKDTEVRYLGDLDPPEGQTTVLYARIVLLDANGKEVKTTTIFKDSIAPKPGCYRMKNDDYLWIVNNADGTDGADQLSQGTEIKYLGQDPQNAAYVRVAEVDASGNTIREGLMLASAVQARPAGWTPPLAPRELPPSGVTASVPRQVPMEARMPPRPMEGRPAQSWANPPRYGRPMCCQRPVYQRPVYYQRPVVVRRAPAPVVRHR